MGVVDVETCAVGEHGGRRSGQGQLLGRGAGDALGATGRREVVRIVGEKRRVDGRPRHAHAAQVVEGVLTRVVPPHDARPLALACPCELISPYAVTTRRWTGRSGSPTASPGRYTPYSVSVPIMRSLLISPLQSA